MINIPEGATHTYTGSGVTSFRKKSGIYWFGYVDGDWVVLYDPASHCYVPIQAKPEWSGEGLPPVGAVVFCGAHNLKVEILKDPELVPYVSAPCRALDNNELFWGGNFSPIKTPEQIAADENRLRGIEEIHEILLKRIGISDLKLVSGFYDAHRKQVAK